MSAMLFNMTIYCVMRRTTDDQSWGIRWTLLSTLEDVDFGDDLALVSHTHQHIQEKTTRLSTYTQRQHTLGVPSKSWPGTDRRGDPS